MRRDVEGRVSAEGGGEHSASQAEAGQRLIEEIRPLLDRHGVETETLAGALEEALLEDGENGKDKHVSGEELRSSIVALIVWKIFVSVGERR